MTASETNFCSLCNDDETYNEAVKWCRDCEVFLCKDCEKHHSKSQMFKNHKTMSSNDYHKIPEFMRKISSHCRDHRQKFELYCPFHACPCCVQCIIDKHKICQDMKPLSDILQQVKSSASVQLLKQDLKDIQENFEEIAKYLKSRINYSNTQKTMAVEEIRSIRKSIINLLDRLEKKVLDDLESKHSKLKFEINALQEQLKQQANQTGQMLSQFSNMTQYATDLQMFVGLGEIEKTTSKAAKYIDDLESKGHFIEKNLEVSISQVLQSVLQDVKSFGDVNIRTEPSTLRLTAGRKDQAQYLVPNIPGIDQIKPTFLKKLTIPRNMRNIIIQNCLILPDGKFLILDFNEKKVVLFNNEGMFMRVVVRLTGYPQDVCFVRNKTVAVSLGYIQQTVLVDVENNKIIKTIDLSQRFDSVASDGHILVNSSKDRSVIVNLNDMSQTILEGVAVTSLSLFKGNIYGISSNDKICCYTSTGELFWTFNHQDIYIPCGITLDNNGFVYVASFANNSIVVVSPDGKTCKKILSEADEIKEPVFIDINRETGMMIVSSKIKDANDDKLYETALVYKI